VLVETDINRTAADYEGCNLPCSLKNISGIDILMVAYTSLQLHTCEGSELRTVEVRGTKKSIREIV
jgi:hypothetical protein